MSEAKPISRRFRFSIRELLLITAILALMFGWWLDHRELTKQNLSKVTVYSLRSTDAKIASTTLQQIYSGHPDVRIVADTTLNRILVRAPSRQHAEIEAILFKLDVPIVP